MTDHMVPRGDSFVVVDSDTLETDSRVRPGGYPQDCAYWPQRLGVWTDETRERRRKHQGRQGRERGEKKKKLVRFPDTLSLGPQPAERLFLAVPCGGTGCSLAPPPPPGGRRWLLRMRAASRKVPRFLLLPYAADGSRLRPMASGADSSAPSRKAATPPQTQGHGSEVLVSWRPAVAPLTEGSRQQVPRFLLLPDPADGSRLRPRASGADLSAPSRTAATPPHLRPRTWREVFAPSGHTLQHHRLGTAIPLSGEDSDSMSLLPPGFWHHCNKAQ
ncbi:hypothetical protein IRJ41_017979 [Triplophysa rosa]|uniref:Uncharacterized protein n=1 Tax=Triplophysa rosa TaxID=992332 RepID=A0A9W7TRR9_TRIRA|nr:hypothetical protein IRJ41_017979 [Triplophysa rosa]